MENRLTFLLISIKNWLDEHYPQRWIGRGATDAWPHRSPDPMHLDFYFRGSLKGKGYANEIATRDTLAQRLEIAKKWP